MKTQLLVSIRSHAECLTVMPTTVDVIDVKEPLRGALGSADVEVIKKIVSLVGGRRPISVALGELGDFDAQSYASMPPVDFVKIGLSGCANWRTWRQDWENAWERIPGSPRRVAVAYADEQLAQSPNWSSVLSAGVECGCSVLLIDTHDKSAGGLLDWYDLPKLQEIREATARCGIQLALAGSLTDVQIIDLLKIHPDFVAVRTAACHGRRTDRVDRLRVDQISQLLHESRGAIA